MVLMESALMEVELMGMEEEVVVDECTQFLHFTAIARNPDYTSMNRIADFVANNRNPEFTPLDR